MNKLYATSLAAVLVAGTVMAQRTDRPLRTVADPHAQGRPSHVDNTDRVVLWSDDFSTPANWTVGHDGPFDADFEIGTGLTSQGDYPTPAIESTTASNGYAMYDSDFFLNTTSDYEQAHITTANPIDLSASPNVILEFETQYRAFNDEQTFLIISTDGTFPTLDDPLMDISAMPNVFYVFDPAELTQGVSPGNPSVRRFNISCAAGGASQVWVRLQFTGIWGYTWYIDDMSISETGAADLGLFSGYMSHVGDGSEYARIPQSQLGTNLNLGGELYSIGLSDQTNVTINVNITDAGSNSVLNFTTAGGTLSNDPCGIPTLFQDEATTMPALPVGVYTATFTATSDQAGSDTNLDNNTVVRKFEVTSDLYSMDGIDVHPTDDLTLASIGSNSFTDGADGLMVMTYYSINQATTVYGLEVVFSNGTVAGGSMIPYIYDTAEVVLLEAIGSALATGTEGFVGQGEIDNGSMWLLFPGGVALDPGGYFMGVELFSSDNAATIRILDDLTVPQPFYNSSIFIPGDVCYSNGNAMAIRASFSPNIGITEMDELTGITVGPNPTTGLVNISAKESENHNVEVMNALGEVVMTSRFNLNTQLDLTSLANGVYSVRVSTADAAMVQRVVLN